MTETAHDALAIRPATRDDIQEVLALWNRARSAAASTPDDAGGVIRLLEQAPDGLLVAIETRHIVGTLVVGWDGWRGNLYRLAVLPTHRRRGIGRKLVDAAHDQLLAKGAKRVTALVAHDETAAVHTWLAAGYNHDRNIARFVRNL